MKPAPAKNPHRLAALIAEAESQARTQVEGPFRMGARSMRRAIEARLAGFAISASIVADMALPVMPEPTAKPAAGWAWWAGSNEEWYTEGPFSTRAAAVQAGRDEFDGESFNVLEARQGAVQFSAKAMIDAQYFEADDLFDYDHTEPDRVGGADLLGSADAELQALIDGWCDRWRHTLIAPSMFQATRNSEFIAGDMADAGDADADMPV